MFKIVLLCFIYLFVYIWSVCVKLLQRFQMRPLQKSSHIIVMWHSFYAKKKKKKDWKLFLQTAHVFQFFIIINILMYVHYLTQQSVCTNPSIHNVYIQHCLQEKPWKGTWTGLQWTGVLLEVSRLSWSTLWLNEIRCRPSTIRLYGFFIYIYIYIWCIKTVLTGVWNSAGLITSNLYDVRSWTETLALLVLIQQDPTFLD